MLNQIWELKQKSYSKFKLNFEYQTNFTPKLAHDLTVPQIKISAYSKLHQTKIEGKRDLGEVKILIQIKVEV